MERALEHIREAEEFSREIGGTDEDVKEYFFSLPESEIDQILEFYAEEYEADNPGCRAYAEKTLPKWRSGQVRMSGMVAQRLFGLLPPLMPLQKKYQLTESLWKHVGPSSKRLLRVGPDVNLDSALSLVEEHISGVVSHYIPDSMMRRFEWLSAGDVQMKQKLLNHIQNAEKALVVNAARAQLPVMLEHMKGDGGQYTHRMAQILKVGKHELEIRFDPTVSGAQLGDWKPQPTQGLGRGSVQQDLTWLWWLLAFGAAVAFFYYR